MKAYGIIKTYKGDGMMGVNDELTLVAINERVDVCDELARVLPITWVDSEQKIPGGIYTFAWLSGRNGRVLHVEDAEVIETVDDNRAGFYAQTLPIVEVLMDRNVKFNEWEVPHFPTGSEFPLCCAGKIAMRTWHTSGTGWLPLIRKTYVELNITIDGYTRRYGFLTLRQAEGYKKRFSHMGESVKFSTYIHKC